MTIADDVRQEQRVWAESDSLRFFQVNRQRPEDLYPSERFFLPDILRRVRTVLDVGAAAGGFSRIMKSFNPDLDYTGIDINPQFVDMARRSHPESRFELGDGIHFDTPEGTYDLVHTSGILHLNSRYREIVAACYRQARRYVVCDFRLTRGPHVEGTFTLEFHPGGGKPLLPYIVLNVDELIDLLRGLDPAPEMIHLRGYYHPPSQMAALPLERVLMTAVALEKPLSGAGRRQVLVDLPA